MCGEAGGNGRVVGAVDRGAGVRNEPTREKKKKKKNVNKTIAQIYVTKQNFKLVKVVNAEF